MPGSVLWLPVRSLILPSPQSVWKETTAPRFTDASQEGDGICSDPSSFLGQVPDWKVDSGFKACALCLNPSADSALWGRVGWAGKAFLPGTVGGVRAPDRNKQDPFAGWRGC